MMLGRQEAEGMGDIHQLIEAEGYRSVRDRMLSAHDKRRVDIAAAILADEAEKLGFTHSGFCLTSLPHKHMSDEESHPLRKWKRECANVTLLIEAGSDRHGNVLGLPYGSLARMILLYLQTKSIQTGSRTVELGGSMRSWLESMGVSVGGKTYQLIMEQANRLSACRLTFFSHNDSGDEVRINGSFVKSAIMFRSRFSAPEQPELWTDTVELDESFWEALQRHPVPLREEALRQIRNKSAAIDIYVWLAYRLHSLKSPTFVPWPALHAQFGASFSLLKQFKPDFVRNLQLALAAYPEARVDDVTGGVMLHKSPPPVLKTHQVKALLPLGR